MGIKNFTSIFKYSSNSKTIKTFDHFSDTNFAIDAHNVIYAKFKTSVKKYIDIICLDDCIDIGVIIDMTFESMMTYVKPMMAKNITPIFIFDGVPPECKRKTNDKRKAERVKYELLAKEAKSNIDFTDIVTIENYKKYIIRSIYPDRDVMKIIMDKLQSVKIPTIQAKGEAEKLCSSLCREGICSAVISNDSDSLVFSAHTMIKSISRKGLECISLSDILTDLDITFDQFVDICIMSGCDYNSNIPGIGICKSIKLIKEYKSIDNLPEKLGNIILDKSILNYVECREQFGYTESNLLISDDCTLFDCGCENGIQQTNKLNIPFIITKLVIV
ncbi:MAG: hypothetical protein COA94_02150 [Rickettsiales bacterium]|nr:MAG: hypothetical protein COA94_02150 [Rickettsiales bacterium]